MRTLIAAVAVLLPLSSAGAAEPLEALYAQLSGISGKVLVDRGGGFVPVAETTKLKPGNRILVSGAGSALLTYGPGCSMPLAADSLTTFTGTESCVIGTQGTPSPGTGMLTIVTLGSLAPAGLGVTKAVTQSNSGTPEPQS